MMTEATSIAVTERIATNDSDVLAMPTYTCQIIVPTLSSAETIKMGVFPFAVSDNRVFFAAQNKVNVLMINEKYFSQKDKSISEEAVNAAVLANESSSALVVSKNGETLYSGVYGEIRVWSCASPTSTKLQSTGVRTLTGHGSWVQAFVLLEFDDPSNDDKLFSGSNDKTIRVWSCSTANSPEGHQHLQTLKGHTDSVIALAVHKINVGSVRLFSGSADKTIRVWKPKSEYNFGNYEHAETLSGHTGAVSSLAVSPDGKLYSGSFDCTIRVWAPGNEGSYFSLHTLKGHDDWVLSLTLMDSGHLFSGSRDKSIRIW